jgi:hypothetical protein
MGKKRRKKENLENPGRLFFFQQEMLYNWPVLKYMGAGTE